MLKKINQAGNEENTHGNMKYLFLLKFVKIKDLKMAKDKYHEKVKKALIADG